MPVVQGILLAVAVAVARPPGVAMSKSEWS
jgi:hypothetical protein